MSGISGGCCAFRWTLTAHRRLARYLTYLDPERRAHIPGEAFVYPLASHEHRWDIVYWLDGRAAFEDLHPEVQTICGLLEHGILRYYAADDEFGLSLPIRAGSSTDGVSAPITDVNSPVGAQASGRDNNPVRSEGVTSGSTSSEVEKSTASSASAGTPPTEITVGQVVALKRPVALGVPELPGGRATVLRLSPDRLEAFLEVRDDHGALLEFCLPVGFLSASEALVAPSEYTLDKTVAAKLHGSIECIDAQPKAFHRRFVFRGDSVVQELYDRARKRVVTAEPSNVEAARKLMALPFYEMRKALLSLL
jgi:hypothetical protein